jgi:uncharacterized protein YqgC (DUF456 family)
MDILLLLIGFLMVAVGVAGSFLPVIPGPLCGWLGLLIIHLTGVVPMDWYFLGITLSVAVLVFILDYFIPIWGTKRFGGTKAGAYGAGIGMLVGLFMGPIGIIFGPFIGALAGEISQKTPMRQAYKAAFGSFIGFLTGTFLKFLICITFLVMYVLKFWVYKGDFL